MLRRGSARRIVRLIFAFGAVAALTGAPAAAAAADGPCTASFNGVESSQIDSLDSPLELDVDDVLTFHGTDQTGTQNARVEVVLAMVTMRDSAVTYGPLQNEFSASLKLNDVSPYGVGLYRINGITDNCTVEAWVRISGRFPFATLTGLTAGALAMGGFAAQMTAIAARRRRSAWAAAVAGLVTGTGLAGIGQQFGKMQLSIPSVLIVAAIAAIIGTAAAFLLSPSEGSGFISKRRTVRAQKRSIRYQARLEAARLDAERREAEADAAEVAQEAAAAATAEVAPPAPDPAPIPEPVPDPTPPPPVVAAIDEPVAIQEPVHDTTPDPEPAPAPKPVVAAPTPEPVAPSDGPGWCYVLAPVDVFDLADHTRTVGMLRPGNWYLAKRQVGAWVQVAAAEGIDGWVAASAIHRHG